MENGNRKWNTRARYRVISPELVFSILNFLFHNIFLARILKRSATNPEAIREFEAIWILGISSKRPRAAACGDA
jgi:hypothetical protein